MQESNDPQKPFGKVPNAAEGFRNLRNDSERKENHTLTVREVARLFETAGVARTERSIINWCQPNKMGVPRLDCYFDPNERRYFISLQSVELAIKEEQARAAKTPQSSEPVRNTPKPSGSGTDDETSSRDRNENAGVKTLEREIRDLKITNQAKDYYIDRLEKERENFVEKLMTSSHRVGELEAKLLQLEAPLNSDSAGHSV
jgi:hypothetical protein